jgi:5'-nucleotidase
MDRGLSALSSKFGPDVSLYMSKTGTPFLSKITAALIKQQPSDPERFVYELLKYTLEAGDEVTVASVDGATPTNAAPAVAATTPTASHTTPTNKPPTGPKATQITLLHFNDVYNIEGQSREPVGGAARFVTAVSSEFEAAETDGGEEPIVIFSGDAFNPSLMSTVTRGKQMIPVLNASRIDVACMGNHDFDFGIENLESLTRVCDFPWLISNVKYVPTGRNLAEGFEHHIVTRGNRRIGFIGLVEYEWMATLATIDEDEIDYEAFVDCARRLSKTLRIDHHCDAVIAITHMRVPNDELLAAECGDVLDLICGGHDHHYDVKPVGGANIYVCKSGTDFRDLTSLKMTFEDDADGNTVSAKITGDPKRIVIDSSVAEDPTIKAVVQRYLGVLGAEMEKRIGHSNVDLDARFQMIRTQETNIGNFVTDIMRRGTSADVAILNSGTLRADCIIPAGDFRMKDMVALLPMVDETCLLELTGEQLYLALENGVSQYPRLEGRFPQVSGISFSFDANLEPGKRVLFDTMKINNQPVTKEGKYSVCTKAYLAKGKDGFDVFKDAKVLVDEESSPVLPTLVRNTFVELEIVNGFEHSRRGSVMKSAEKWKRNTFHATPEKKSSSTSRTTPRKDGEALNPKTSIVEEGGHNPHGVSHGIHPQIEGRIVCINPAVIEIL